MRPKPGINPSASADSPAVQLSSGQRPVTKVLGYSGALILLAASIWFALSQQGSDAWRPLLAADFKWLIALAATIVISALAIPGLLFWLGTKPFVTTKPLSLWAMTKISAASLLLNYTPFKAGLIGRIGYLRYVHGVGYAAAIVSHGLILAVYVAACAISAIVTLWQPQFGPTWFLACAIGLSIAALTISILFSWLRPAIVPVTGPIAGSLHSAAGYTMVFLLAQCMMLFTIAIRWWIVFRILGQPVDLATAWLLAILHTVIQLAGPANGLGLREWLVGISGGITIAGVSGAFQLAEGLSAALIDRAAEAVIVVVLGAAALIGLSRMGFFEGDPNNTESRGPTN